MNTNLSAAAEFIPVVLAIIAIVMLAHSYGSLRRRNDALFRIIGIVSCIVLTIAQTSWWQSAIIEGDLVGTWFSNKLWLVFNSLVMINYIIISLPRRTKQ